MRREIAWAVLAKNGDDISSGRDFLGRICQVVVGYIIMAYRFSNNF
jgi:hypothetical protein